MQLEKIFAEAIAPGQSEVLISQVLHNEDEDGSTQLVPEDLVVPVKMFQESDSVGQIFLLSVINHKKYTKEALMKIFNCKKHQIEKARKLQKQNREFSIPKKENVNICRMPQEKIEHFLEFMFCRGLLQNVAYGVNKIKFDNGEEKKVANAILMMKFSHTITFYKEVCQETNYLPMSDTSLWRILRGIKPSQRKALAGLDDVTAAGMDGFQTLIAIFEKWKYKNITKFLEKGKKYLKSNYPFKCSESFTLHSHSTSFALSDIDPDLNQPFIAAENEQCFDVANLISAINQVRELVIESKDEDLLYDLNVATEDVEAYMKHQIRDAQQNMAKIMAFEQLDEETGFWLKDFCQKILPAKFRESQ
ncbi:uncharacterized protein LOC136091546 [Hydra vulgaris]|uniref:Uncharacterized protein LOC136091546 n=1 Tax=Hydra vulgaris TaxID=6087 RepID=A0ABM4DL70_HYDVU